MKLSKRWLSLAMLLFVLAACGGDGDSTGSSNANGSLPVEDDIDRTDSDESPSGEDDLARSLVLTVDDFPTGWAETPADRDEDDNPFDECDPGTAPGRTGVAETGDFSRGGAASVSQEVAVFDTPENAVNSLERIQQIADCLIEVVRDGSLDDDEFEYSDAKFGSLSFPSFGDTTDAYRLEIHVAAKEESGLGSEGTVYLDIVRVVEGRLGFAMQATDVFSPFDVSTLESIVSEAYDKLVGAD